MVKRNEDGTIDIPLNTQLNLIVGKNVENNILKEFEYKKISIVLKDDVVLVEEHSQPLFITPDEIIASEDQFLVNGKDIQNPGSYQLLSYCPINGFTSNQINYNY